MQPTEMSTERRSPASSWWREAVLYECHLPSFRDGNGDGIGDLEGLTSSLDYLKHTLGVDAIWCGPFFRSPLLDQGFDVSDYCDVEPVFGSLAIFDRLIKHAHERGLKIIVDYIPNHTSNEHPWFCESRSSLTNDKRDWYVWRDPRADGSPPNNWTSETGGSVWEWDETTGQYYLHSHLVQQPDLNWRNPQVRAALFDVLRFWLDRGADGFRIDVAHMLMKDPELRDNPLAEGGNDNPFDLQHPDFGTQLHVHDRRHPDTHATLAEIRGVVDDYPDRVTIAEIEAMSWQDWALYFGSDHDGIHLPFAFRLLETVWTAADLRRELSALYAALPPGAWPVLALGNHDRTRLVTRLGPEQAKVAAVLLLTLQGTPCLLYGDELGLADQSVPRERQRDYFGLAEGGVSRDPTRTPMPWNDGVNFGFSTAPEDELWLPLSRVGATVNVVAQQQRPTSHLALYQRLIRMRVASPALHQGTIDLLDPGGSDGDGSVLAYVRRCERDVKAVALNLTGEPTTVVLPSAGTVVVSTSAAIEGQRTGSHTRLEPHQAIVVDLPQKDEWP